MTELFAQVTSSYHDESDDAFLAQFFAPLRDLVREAGPGRFFGNYELLGVIGVGGQGVVYKARQIHVGKLVALKLVNAEDRPRSLRELCLVSDLEHEHLVRVYHVGEHDGRLYFTMQLADRGSLKDNLDSLRLRPTADRAALAADHRRLAGFVASIARAVAYLHGQGVVHRDLKPGNVLIDGNGKPLVTDLGLAWRKKQAGEVAGQEGSADTEKTVQAGTYVTMAPEQMMGAVPTPAADVYSLGVILFQLLTGQLPFNGNTTDELRERVCGPEAAPSPFALNEAVGAGSDLELICRKCLSKQAEDRYLTAKELADDLGAVRDRRLPSVRRPNWLVRTAQKVYDVLVAPSPDPGPELMSWSWIDLTDAVLTAGFHGGVYFLAAEGVWAGWVWLSLLAYLVVWWGMFFGFLLRAPVQERERHIVFIWGLVYAGWAVLMLGHCPPLPGVSAAAVLDLYPAWVIMTGMAFFVIGRTWWGSYSLVGLAHLVCAALMPLDLSFAPLVYAGLNAVCMIWQGIAHRSKAARSPR